MAFQSWLSFHGYFIASRQRHCRHFLHFRPTLSFSTPLTRCRLIISADVSLMKPLAADTPPTPDATAFDS
jgi:hypothetical protein